MLYDILGREVEKLVGEFKPAGRYSVSFNGNNLSSGLYIYQLKAGEFISTKKMVLLK
ncbi:MAG: T9SS type A sorting domain-containing protein [bacterium]